MGRKRRGSEEEFDENAHKDGLCYFFIPRHFKRRRTYYNLIFEIFPYLNRLVVGGGV